MEFVSSLTLLVGCGGAVQAEPDLKSFEFIYFSQINQYYHSIELIHGERIQECGSFLWLDEDMQIRN